MLVESRQEESGRWVAGVAELRVVEYGKTREEAITKAKARALAALATRLEHGQPVPAVVDRLFEQPFDESPAELDSELDLLRRHA
ncbi:MAG: type II toxin-antitoxin system HicB family antitoxin [Candidatus Binatia bacterium]